MSTPPTDPAAAPAANRGDGTDGTARGGAPAVEWRDLLAVGPIDRVGELALSLPWLGLSWFLAHNGWIPLALVASFFFFLTALRQVHGAFHHSLGLSRRGDHVVQLVWSVLMLGSIHALGVNHLRHHRLQLGSGDEEGYPALLPWWRAVLYGPVFIVRCSRTGWRHAAHGIRAWIVVEVASNLLWVGAVLTVLRWPCLLYHTATMLVANCLAAFFCVWTVHRGQTAVDGRARTLRGRWRNLVSANMFLHDEHHRYPAIPTRRLHELAERLDRRRPLVAPQVF